MVVVGLIAGALTTACWIPQVVRSFRHRNAHAFDWRYLTMITTGVAMWFVYGLLRGDLAIELANGITLLLTLGMVAMKIEHGREAAAKRGGGSGTAAATASSSR